MGLVGQFDYKNERLLAEVEKYKEQLRQEEVLRQTLTEQIKEDRKNRLGDDWGVGSFYDYSFVAEVGDDGLFTGKEIATPCFRAIEKCFTQDKLFAASRRFPRGSRLNVINLENQKSVEVVVVDYIEHPERVIDLTSFAFSQIALLELGLIDVRIEYLGVDKSYPQVSD